MRIWSLFFKDFINVFFLWLKFRPPEPDGLPLLSDPSSQAWARTNPTHSPRGTNALIQSSLRQIFFFLAHAAKWEFQMDFTVFICIILTQNYIYILNKIRHTKEKRQNIRKDHLSSSSTSFWDRRKSPKLLIFRMRLHAFLLFHYLMDCVLLAQGCYGSSSHCIMGIRAWSSQK